jgi:hypothetical protein
MVDAVSNVEGKIGRRYFAITSNRRVALADEELARHCRVYFMALVHEVVRSVISYSTDVYVQLKLLVVGQVDSSYKF